MPTERGTQFEPPHQEATGEFVTEANDKTEGTDKTSADSLGTLGSGTLMHGVHVPVEGNKPDESATLLDVTGVFEPGAAKEDATQKANPGATGDVTGLDGTAGYMEGATGEYNPNAATGAPEPARNVRKQVPPGKLFCNRYILKKFHAKGGMGEIWLAEDYAIGRAVALKRMLGRRAGEQQRRFRVEAQITGQLEHPGIVPVHELGANEGQPFYTMKFVHGRTLKKVIEQYHQSKGNPSVHELEHSRLVQNFLSLCQTVAYAHSRGVLHRDLKPENVMLGAYGETLLLDWGIAKVMGQPDLPTDVDPHVRLDDASTAAGTQEGTIMGSPSYMSPEVANGFTEKVDERSDIYLLGATLYEILTNQMPRAGSNAIEMIMKAVHERPVPPRKIDKTVSKTLEAICLKAMAYKQEDRYQTAAELAADMERYLAGEPVTAYRESFAMRALRWAKRHRTALTRTAMAVFVVAVVGFGYVTIRDLQQRFQAEEEKKKQAQIEADHLKELNQARSDIEGFQRLADNARYAAAVSGYTDPTEGQESIHQALAAAEKWGPTVELLALPEDKESDRAVIQKEIYDLRLLQIQTRLPKEVDVNAAREVLPLLEKAEKLHAPTRSYYRFRALAYVWLGEKSKAEADEMQVNDPKTPTTAMDHFLDGEQYRRVASGAVGEMDKADLADLKIMETAIAEYRKALVVDPSHYWSHLQIGRCQISLNRNAEAVATLGACIALQRKSPWAYNARAMAFKTLKRYPEAEKDLNYALEQLPGDQAARLNRGLVYWAQKNKNAVAMADFDKVLEESKDKYVVEAAYYRGQLHLEKGEVAEGLKDFDLVVAKNPNFRPVRILQAEVLAALGKTELALAALDAYLADKSYAPGSWQQHARRGAQLRLWHADLPIQKRGEAEGKGLALLAVAELLKAAAMGAPAPEVYDNLGAMLEHYGKGKEAQEAYNKGLELSALSGC